MDLVKVVLEAARKEGHLEDLCGDVPMATPVTCAELDGHAAGSGDSVPSTPKPADAPADDTIAFASNVSCNNPTVTVDAGDTLLQVRGLSPSFTRPCTSVRSVSVALFEFHLNAAVVVYLSRSRSLSTASRWGYLRRRHSP